jgi:response regulator RpfG family c-di-GMP phosphodiesterase
MSKAGKATVPGEGTQGADSQNCGIDPRQLEHLYKYAEIGMALSGESNVNRLLEMIIHEAREITRADAGTLYMVDEEGLALNFVILQNDTMKVRMGGTSGVAVNLPPVPLLKDGAPNHANVSSHVALTGELVNIADVYESKAFDFTGPRKYDEATGYRSKSMLVIPMRNHENDIIGVLQLLNAKDFSHETVEFSDDHVALIASLASQAAAALTKTKLIADLKDLFYAFIKSIAGAIEEKSPYTGGHINRVVDLTMMMAEKINAMTEGPFAEVHFSEDDLEELKLAAWLHDVGKITTPESVVDKANKLETIFDRVHYVAQRFDLIAKSMETEGLRRTLELVRSGAGPEALAAEEEKLRAAQAELAEEKAFILSCNEPGEFMSDERIARMRAIGAKTYPMGGQDMAYLTDNEMENLSIRKGTLTNDERKVIENHATMTGKILGELPFPKKLARVPAYAAAHHEKVDGSGYPLGLGGADLPLQARIMAVADIFEALTAKDRPYKKPMPLSQAVKILGFMKKDKHVDADVHDLFLASSLFKEYAKKELNPEQFDSVDPEPELKMRRVLLGMPPGEERDALKAIFSGWSGEVVELADGVECLKELTSAFRAGHPYRVALLDMALENMDGFAVAGELARSERGFPQHSIILTTDRHAPGDASRAVEAGASGYLVRPVDKAQIKKLVFAIMEQPAQAVVSAPVRSRDACDSVCARPRLLMVDDSANSRMLVHYYLGDRGFETDYAENGRQGVDLFVAKEYDLVISGMDLPVMDGYEMVRTIRRWEKRNEVKRTPILAMVNHFVANAEAKGLEAGCTACLIKPITKSRLIALVEQYIPVRQGE